ncbi:MAG: hypothetical protein P1V20_07505 [Verrucomicrobiales bacterium]|nr:hypothetical protein [Verrucomicrobiales bacterium]
MKCAGKLWFGILTAIVVFLSDSTQAGTLPEGWSRLKIRLPGVKAEPEVVGMGHSYVGRRLDGFRHELILPTVAWIRIGAPTRKGNLETLIPYRGAGEWVVTIDDLVVSVSRDGAPPEVVGVSLPVNDAEDFLASFDASTITQPVSLELRNAEHPALIPKVPFPFHAIVADDIKFDGVSSLWIMS